MVTDSALRLASVLVWTATVVSQGTNEAQVEFGPSTFTVPGAFPTSVYKHYYNNPTATSAQVQPVISDPVTHETYPFALTNPDTIPKNDTTDPHILPPPASSSQILEQAFNQIISISQNPIFAGDTCQQCQAALEVAKFVALAAPQEGPTLAVRVCEAFDFNSDCGTAFGINTVGSVITQVAAFADVGGFDGQMLCQHFLGLCPVPPASPLNLTGWFAKPKPTDVTPKPPSGKKVKVLHVSDLHIDPRYSTGAEANCSSSLCCRANNFNTASPNASLFPAPRFGSYRCDAPYALIGATLEAIPVLAGTEEDGFAWTVFTGDLVSHDPENELSRDYTSYAETVLYDVLKRISGSAPVYPVLGNHDTYNEAQDAIHSLPDGLGTQFSWNYDHVASLWEQKGWLSSSVAQTAKAHYLAYSVNRGDGLRIITLNTDMWYTANYYNYINMTQLDPSGLFRFVTDELQAAEDAGDRVWIIGHVLTGWDGTNPLKNPTNFFYQIVDRFSPHVIAALFFGHTHEDQEMIYYANNATVQSAETAQTVGWIGPSVTPDTNLNSGFRVYEVDPETFDILDAHTWFADVNSFPGLDSQTEFGPTYRYEYSTRDTYGPSVAGWGPNDPLNATWWHLVTEAMEANSSLVQTFHTFQGKTSVRTPVCTDECVAAKICYIRSGSAPIALQNCPTGFGSVQS